MKTWTFWNLTILLGFGQFYTLYMANVYKNIALGLVSDKILTTAGAIGSVCNGLSRVMWTTL